MVSKWHNQTLGILDAVKFQDDADSEPTNIRSDEKLTLETWTFQIFHSGDSTFIGSFGETKFTCFTLPSTQHHSFFMYKKFGSSSCLHF